MKDYYIPKHTVIQYVRDKKGIPYGVVVAIKSENGFDIGYSLCRKNDRFSKDMALKIAIGRAELSVGDLPHSVRHMLPAFREIGRAHV